MPEIDSRWRLTVLSEAQVRDHGDVPLLFNIKSDPAQDEEQEAVRRELPDDFGDVNS